MLTVTFGLATKRTYLLSSKRCSSLAVSPLTRMAPMSGSSIMPSGWTVTSLEYSSTGKTVMATTSPALMVTADVGSWAGALVWANRAEAPPSSK